MTNRDHTDLLIHDHWQRSSKAGLRIAIEQALNDAEKRGYIKGHHNGINAKTSSQRKAELIKEGMLRSAEIVKNKSEGDLDFALFLICKEAEQIGVEA